MAKSDIEIAREATMLPIGEVAARLEVPEDAIQPYGQHIAKIGLDFVDGGRGPARRAPDPGHGDHADARGRGQDHDHGRAQRCAQPDRQEGDELHPRAVARARASA